MNKNKRVVWQQKEGQSQNWATSSIVIQCPNCKRLSRMKVALELK